ncbi:glycosyl hydrolase [Sphingomonas koreensis]|nr:glycosyl hydrolase [Sphingomonas koreensis]
MGALLASRLGKIGAGAIALVVIAAALFVYAIGWRPPTGKYAIQGVDVSEAQGDIDWNVLNARGTDFAYLRATFGAAGRDSRFADYWPAAGAADIRRGAVHIWSFCDDPVKQADNFLTTVPRTDDALPALLAIGFSPDCAARPPRAAVIAGLRRFLSMAETHTGEPMLLKISKPAERAYQISAAIPRPVWEMRNFIAPDYAARPWRVWQASDIRRVDGVAGPINWDVVAP